MPILICNNLQSEMLIYKVYSMQQFILINNHSNVLIQMNNYDLYIYSYFSWIMQFVVILLIVANVSITHNFN